MAEIAAIDIAVLRARLEALPLCDRAKIRAKKPNAVSEARVEAIRAQLHSDGDALSIWRSSAEVDAYVSDLLAGEEMNPSLWGLAMKAARDGHDAETIAAHLRALLDASEGHATRPDRVEELEGEINSIAKRAVETAGAKGSTPYVPAAEDFDAAPDAGDVELDCRERMFRDYAWCRPLKRIVKIATGELFDRGQFDPEAGNAEVGDPASSKESAWAWMMRSPHKRQDVAGITFRPGQGRLINEPGIGVCVNTWQEHLGPRFTNTPDDEAVRPWLDHAAFIIPDDREREIVLNWMAWVIQNPSLKPNWALVLGSTNQGTGKDLFFEALRAGVGEAYYDEISANALTSDFNDYIRQKKVLFIQEMQNFERRRTANLLKPLIAAPPHYLRVNEKGDKPYQTPNIMACVFMTNEHNAVEISNGDRRYFVSWFEGMPRDGAYYTALANWLKDGGATLAATWLKAKALGEFDCYGRAPDSRAKVEMHKATRAPLLGWLEDAIADGDDPFGPDLVCLAHICARAPEWVMTRARTKPTPTMVAMALQSLGVSILPRMRMGRGTSHTMDERMRIAVVRRAEMYANVEPEKLRQLFWEQYDRHNGGQRRYDALC